MMAKDTHDARLPGILRLSPEIRRRIYLDVGLGFGERYGRHPAMYDLCGQNSVTKTYVGYTLGFYGLLVSCRTIHAEAAALVYSTNWFMIRYKTRQSLSALRALTPVALSSLTSLKIILNQTSCHEQKIGCEGYGGCCEDIWDYNPDLSTNGCAKIKYHRDSHDSPLDGSDQSTEALLVEWQATLAHLAPHIAPQALELSLVCDIQRDDVSMAKLVVAALGMLPPLKDCHIRLSGTRHSQLQQVAQEAVLRTRGLLPARRPLGEVLLPSASLSSRLVNLPRELRLRILEYTDLITPWKEVMWHRGKRGYQIHTVPCFPLEGRGDCNPDFHHGCQYIQCSIASYPQPSIGCFCHRYHAAYSSRCRCWSPPTPLFLVSQTLYLDANLVFYGKNRFIVVDGPTNSPFIPWPVGEYEHGRFAASEFLRGIVPPYCLGYIRFLELVFAPFPHQSWPADGHPAVQNWAETLDWAKDKLNLPGLTLRLIMAGNGEWAPDGSREMTQAQGKEVLAGYRRILGPLACLDTSHAISDRGLARFYAKMTWPWKWDLLRTLLGAQRYDEIDQLEAKDRELKHRTERFILRDRYDRVRLDDREPQSSVWEWSCLRDG